MATESNKERVDRELVELLNEVRVAIPGAQVLLASSSASPSPSGSHRSRRCSAGSTSPRCCWSPRASPC